MEAISREPAVHEALVHRVRGEYAEMPGLSPTFAQARRLFGIDDASCCVVLDTLVRTRFLSQTGDGRYIRVGRA